MTARKNTSPRPAALPPLAQHRIHNGVTLEQIEESTKISLRFLRAIENEEYKVLPGGIFARSYIRQYASAIGFDEDELLARYHRSMGPDSTSEERQTRRPMGREKGRKRTGLGLLRVLGSIRLF
jgi:cytoskeletal protein RodZ